MALFEEVVFLVVLLGLSGFFSGSEVALVSLSRAKAQHMYENKRFGSHYIKRLKDDPHRMLATILIGNNLVNVGASAMATSMAIEIFRSYAVGIATGVMTLLLLVFGEITPKSVATTKNELVSQLVAAPIWYLSIVLAPVLNILDTFLNRLFKLIGIRSKEKAITEEEIISMVKTAEQEGSIRETEKLMVSRIFELDKLTAGEAAIPRGDMTTIDSKAKVGDAIQLAMKTNYSRIPVHERHKDNIIGVVYVKELLRSMEERNKSIKQVMRKPYVVPESKNLSSLLRQFQKRKQHMAIVVDEHGAVAGLVTLEDILEEIVGDITDETELKQSNINSAGKNMWLAMGKASIKDVNHVAKMRLKEQKDFDTISGFILSRAGRIPNQGEQFAHGKFILTVEELDRHRISKVRIEKK